MSSQIPSFRELNVPIANAAGLFASGGNELVTSPDPLIMSYEREILGEDKHEDIIVGQQVIHAFKVLLNAKDEKAFTDYLVDKMNYDEFSASRKFNELKGMGYERWSSPKLESRFVAAVVEGSCGWQNAPQNFIGTADIVDRLMENNSFSEFCYEQASSDEKLEKPVPFVGEIKFKLGYAQTTKPVTDLYGGWQAIRRYANLGLNSASQAFDISNLANASAPFPPQAEKFIPAEIKRVQAVSRLYLATINAHLQFADKAYSEEIFREIKNLGVALAAQSADGIRPHFEAAIAKMPEGSFERNAVTKQLQAFDEEAEVIKSKVKEEYADLDIADIEKKLTRYFAFSITILKEQELITPEQYSGAFAYYTTKVEKHSEGINQIPFLVGLGDAHKAAAEIKGNDSELSFSQRIFSNSFSNTRTA